MKFTTAHRSCRGAWRRDLPPVVARYLRVSARAQTSELTEIVRSLMAPNWNKTKAAQSLRWSRMTFYRRMTRYQIAH